MQGKLCSVGWEEACDRGDYLILFQVLQPPSAAYMLCVCRKGIFAQLSAIPSGVNRSIQCHGRTDLNVLYLTLSTWVK